MRFKAALKGLYDAQEIETLTLLIVNEITALSKAQIKAFPEYQITEQETERLSDILLQLKTGKPIQYILGKTEFYGLPFYVDQSVLIPRPETEELVEWVIALAGSKFKAEDKQLPAGILDIGTGSGCIAISLKKNLSRFNVSALDISTGALHKAAANAKLNNVEIDFIEADVLNINATTHLPKFEIIVSNPPYVTLHDKLQMHINVTDFEPHTALFVPENDPLIFYKANTAFALKNLSPSGLLFFEINESYGKETVDLLHSKGFKNIELRKDLSGRDRMVKAENGQ